MSVPEIIVGTPLRTFPTRPSRPRMVAHTVDRLHNNPLIQQSINPRFMLALALFVAGVGADDTYDALALDDLAILAELLN